jgi:hypothetical protein
MYHHAMDRAELCLGIKSRTIDTTITTAAVGERVGSAVAVWAISQLRFAALLATTFIRSRTAFAIRALCVASPRRRRWHCLTLEARLSREMHGR